MGRADEPRALAIEREAHVAARVGDGPRTAHVVAHARERLDRDARERRSTKARGEHGLRAFGGTFAEVFDAAR
jgi:hypothetical protein